MKRLSGKYKAPLIEVENTIVILDDIDGWGLPCESPYYSIEELDYIRILIFFGVEKSTERYLKIANNHEAIKPVVL